MHAMVHAWKSEDRFCSSWFSLLTEWAGSEDLSQVVTVLSSSAITGWAILLASLFPFSVTYTESHPFYDLILLWIVSEAKPILL